MEDQKNEPAFLREATQKFSALLPSVLHDADLEYTTNIDELVVKAPGELIQTICKTDANWVCQRIK